MEFDSARFPNYDYRIYHTLIKKSVIELPLLCSPSEYNEACAFYGLFHTIVPLTNGYYILGENKKYINVIYYPDINEYNGFKTLQMVIKNYLFNEGGC